MQCCASSVLKAQKTQTTQDHFREKQVDTKRHKEKQKGEERREMRKDMRR